MSTINTETNRVDWSQYKTVQTVTVGDELPSITIDISLQRLVMEAVANRDLSLMHHDKSVAQATGAKDAYANTFFLFGMIERLAREWAGSKAFLKKIGPLRMLSFNCVGDSLNFQGKVASVNYEDNSVLLDVWVNNGDKVSVTAQVLLTLSE